MKTFPACAAGAVGAAGDADTGAGFYEGAGGGDEGAEGDDCAGEFVAGD